MGRVGEQERDVSLREAQWRDEMAAAQRGDAQACGLLLHALLPALRGFVRRRLSDPNAAEGVVPALCWIAFTRWDAPPRLARAGALAIRATCPAPDALHWIFGHSTGPLAAGLLVLVLLAMAGHLRS